MDADDISCSSRFERQISFLESNPHIGVCGSSIEFFGTKEGIVEYPIQEKDIYLFLETCFAHPTVMIRSSVLESNKYNENIRVSQDFDLWTTLYGKGVHFSNLKEPLLRYRCSDIQITATKAKLQAEVSRNIRRRAFDDYCRIHGFDLVLSGKDLSYGLIVEINKKLSLPKSVSQDLNYYLLSSIDDNCLRMFLNIVVKGFLFKLKWYDILRLLYHTTTNRQPFMF